MRKVKLFFFIIVKIVNILYFLFLWGIVKFLILDFIFLKFKIREKFLFVLRNVKLVRIFYYILLYMLKLKRKD